MTMRKNVYSAPEAELFEVEHGLPILAVSNPKTTITATRGDYVFGEYDEIWE